MLSTCKNYSLFDVQEARYVIFCCWFKLDCRIDKLNQGFIALLSILRGVFLGRIFSFQQNTYNPSGLQDVGNWIKLQDLQTTVSAVVMLTVRFWQEVQLRDLKVFEHLDFCHLLWMTCQLHRCSQQGVLYMAWLLLLLFINILEFWGSVWIL